MTRHCTASACRGFTLLEACAVMLIMALLLVVAAPGMRTLLLGQKVKTVSYELYAALATARSEAITRNANVVIRSGAAGWADGWIVATGDGTELVRQSAYSDMIITGPAQIVFSGNGRPTTEPTPFSLAATDSAVTAQKCLRLHLNGRPYVDQGGCS